MKSPLKYHGGKYYLADRIVSYMPRHVHYVEPFAGSLAVLFAKDPEGVSEVVNDLHGGLTNFWRVLQDTEKFEAFRRIAEATPFSEAEWHDAVDPVSDAVHFFVRCRQSLAGRMKSFSPRSRSRTRRGMNEQCAAWLSAVEGLRAVHERLIRVLVLRRPALDVIRAEDGPGTLFYCDPPYLGISGYEHSMTEAEHAQLLLVLRRCAGRVMLSAYPSELYSDMLQGWSCGEFDLPNNAAGGDSKARETELLWCNWA